MTTTAIRPAPEWLTLRGGRLKPGIRPETLFVVIGDQPLYRLDVRPAAGKFICAVSQTNNGRRLDDPAGTFPTAEAATDGGLERLRTVLGW